MDAAVNSWTVWWRQTSNRSRDHPQSCRRTETKRRSSANHCCASVPSATAACTSSRNWLVGRCLGLWAFVLPKPTHTGCPEGRVSDNKRSPFLRYRRQRNWCRMQTIIDAQKTWWVQNYHWLQYKTAAGDECPTPRVDLSRDTSSYIVRLLAEVPWLLAKLRTILSEVLRKWGWSAPPPKKKFFLFDPFNLFTSASLLFLKRKGKKIVVDGVQFFR